jgi:hypothetical protein
MPLRNYGSTILIDIANIVNVLNLLKWLIKQIHPYHHNGIRRQTQVGEIVLHNNQIGLDPTVPTPVLSVLIMLHLRSTMERIAYR